MLDTIESLQMCCSIRAQSFQDEICREKLMTAEARYRNAARELTRLQDASAESGELVRALDRTATARQEYRRALGVFTDWIVRGVTPKA